MSLGEISRRFMFSVVSKVSGSERGIEARDRLKEGVGVRRIGRCATGARKAKRPQRKRRRRESASRTDTGFGNMALHALMRNILIPFSFFLFFFSFFF